MMLCCRHWDIGCTKLTLLLGVVAGNSLHPFADLIDSFQGLQVVEEEEEQIDCFQVVAAVVRIGYC